MPSPLDKNRPIRTLSIGGATFDLFMKTDASIIHECGELKAFALPFGKKIGVNDVIGTCGGGADNTAVALARLGCDAGFSGVTGDDQWGDAIKKNFEKEGVRTNGLIVIEHEPTSFSLILNAPSGERTILTHKSMDRHFHDVTFDREAASTVDAVYLNHIHEDTCVIEDDLIQILTDTPDVHITWNPGGSQIKAGMQTHGALLAHTDLLMLNKEEALAFSHTSSTKDAMKALIGAGVKIVCVTDGAHGSWSTDGKDMHFCPALEGKIVDTTGAGDAFGSAMTWAILSGKNLPTALKAGTIQAMSVVGAVGAQAGLLTATALESTLEQTPLAVATEPF